MSPLSSPLRLMFASLVLALLSSITLTAHAAPHDGSGMNHAAMGPMGGMGPLGGRHLGRVLDAVNATPEQRTQLTQIFDAARADLQGLRQQGRTLRDQMRQAFTQPTVDARAVESLRQQLVAQHDQASRRMMQAMLEASRVLTPEQRQKIGELSQQRRAMMERHRGERESLERRR